MARSRESTCTSTNMAVVVGSVGSVGEKIYMCRTNNAERRLGPDAVHIFKVPITNRYTPVADSNNMEAEMKEEYTEVTKRKRKRTANLSDAASNDSVITQRASKLSHKLPGNRKKITTIVNKIDSQQLMQAGTETHFQGDLHRIFSVPLES